MRIRKLTAIPILALAMTGCIRDDFGQCRTQENVTFLFTYDSQRGGELTGRIGKIDLFLFDGEGKYLLYRSASADELDADNPGMTFTLDPGTYYALAWGNVGDNSAYENLKPGITSLDDCLIEINPASTRTGDPVYYAPRKARQDVNDSHVGDMSLYEVVVPPRERVTRTLDFVRAHRSIYVWVKGFRDTDDQRPTVEAKGLWSRYDFRYRTRAYRRNFIQQTGAQTMEGMVYAVAVFHHAYGEIDGDMNVLVTRTSDGELSQTVSVRQFVEDNPSTGTDDIHIMLTYVQDLGVTITLPEWIATPLQPGVE